MAQCNCGRQLNESDKLCPRCAALRTLGLEHGVSRNEIRDAYRDLVKVWHPDRFPNDVKLRKKAEEKLKEVNAAFQHLNSQADAPPARAESAAKKPEEKPESQKPYEAPKGSTRSSKSSSASEKEASRPHASAQEPPRPDASASGFPHAPRPSDGNARPQTPTPMANRPFNSGALRSFFSLRKVPHWLVLMLSVSLTRLWMDACKKPTAAQNAMVNQYNEARDKALRQLQSQPTISYLPTTTASNAPKPSQKPVLDAPLKHSRITGAPVMTATENGDANPRQARNNIQSTRGVETGTFTKGSTINEVLAIEGTPSSIIGDTYFFGMSSVSFSSGRVVGWQSSPYNRLKVSLPSRSQASNPGVFKQGSTVDDVLAVEGTPSAIIGDTYFWGMSSVSFSSGRVVGWQSSPFNPLKVKAE